MQNFRYPYFSRDIAEFWRRWHISLTTWFRDYVYIPLGGSRCSRLKSIRNTLIIFAISGFWHGANWTFIIWGIYHAMLFCPLLLLKKNRVHRDVIALGRKLPNFKEFTQVILTFFFVLIGWIIFRSESISGAYIYIKNIFSSSLFTIPVMQGAGVTRGVGVTTLFFIIIMLITEWYHRDKPHGLSLSSHQSVVRQAIYIAVLLSIILFKASSPASFVYFQF
jgi:D-alanyl-lipoteichoic acid acyltransferase DltB (MBOAT superfamily)